MPRTSIKDKRILELETALKVLSEKYEDLKKELAQTKQEKHELYLEAMRTAAVQRASSVEFQEELKGLVVNNPTTEELETERKRFEELQEARRFWEDGPLWTIDIPEVSNAID